MATEVLIEGVEYVMVSSSGSACSVAGVRCSLFPFMECRRMADEVSATSCNSKIFILKSEYPAAELKFITHRLKS
jgi:hypothetical protein